MIGFCTCVRMYDFFMGVVVLNTHTILAIDGHEDRYVGINNTEVEGEPQTSNRNVDFRHTQRSSRTDTEVAYSCPRCVDIDVAASFTTLGVVL